MTSTENFAEQQILCICEDAFNKLLPLQKAVLEKASNTASPMSDSEFEELGSLNDFIANNFCFYKKEFKEEIFRLLWKVGSYMGKELKKKPIIFNKIFSTTLAMPELTLTVRFVHDDWDELFDCELGPIVKKLSPKIKFYCVDDQENPLPPQNHNYDEASFGTDLAELFEIGGSSIEMIVEWIGPSSKIWKTVQHRLYHSCGNLWKVKVVPLFHNKLLIRGGLFVME